MTYHFVNLVSWRYFESNSQNQKLYLDSISIRSLAFLFGVKLEKVSGVSFYNNNRVSFKEALHLVSERNDIHRNQKVLPFWKSVNSIEVTDSLRNEINKYDKLVIGISSPKQDALASQILAEYPDKEIYCLGAAIYTDLQTKRLEPGFLWVFFLFTNPKRTLLKIRITLFEIFSIVLFAQNRKRFRKFLHSIKSTE